MEKGGIEKMIEKRRINELYIRVKDSKGEEEWISMKDFSKLFIEIIGQATNLVFKEIGKDIENSSIRSSEKSG